MERIRAWMLAFASAILLSGCSTLQDVVEVHEAGGGTTETYAVGMDQAWTISKTVFRWEGTDAIEEYRDEGYMLTSSGMNLVSMGAVMGAWLKPVDAGNTEVTVVTKRRVATNLATTLRESTYHSRFAQAVEIVKSGEPLPRTAP